MNWQKLVYELVIPEAHPHRMRYHRHLWEHHRSPVWITKDNWFIPMIFMRDDHLKNTFNLLTRQVQELQAQANIENAVASYAEATKRMKWVETLVNEQMRRNMPVDTRTLVECRDIVDNWYHIFDPLF